MRASTWRRTAGSRVNNAAHALAGCAVAIVVGALLLGWRDRERVDVRTELLAICTMCIGVTFGVAWELVQFALDWLRASDLQPSNTSTSVDLLWTDVGAVVGAVLATRLYCHWLGAGRQRQLGEVAAWLFDGPSRLLDRHGYRLAIVLSVVIAAAVAALWFVGRPVPGFVIA